ncbi:MAG: transglycosylase domain-containing protein [Patescibacteria group bacterium]|nr:transglycosylase domain-containing protein [Patescibacteria group bacterium]
MSYDIHNSPLYAKRKAKFTRQMLRTSPSDSSGKRIPQSGAFSWKKWAKALLVLVFISGFGYLIYLFVTLPSLDGLGEDTLSESTKILDKNGYLLYEIHAGENRTLVDLGTLPTYLPMAFIAIEDDNFYNHYGFDLIGMIKGPLEGLLPGQRARGGSTITQQLVKNALLSSERTISRKLRELLISIQLEMKYDKDSILEMYLNHIAFGSNSYGIESAANTFFGKTSGQLTLAQSAMMAALPKAPSYYSPYGSHPDKLLARRNTVLYRMFELGYISQEDYNEALEEKLEVIPYKEEIVAPHFVMYVIEQLEEQYGRVTLEKEGFKVYTTIDLELQNIAQEAVEWGVERNVSRYDATNASLVAIDPKTGSIQAMVGSVDYFDTANDGNVNVSLAQRQPGSSFKPFAFAAAFLKGYSPATVVYDVETDFAYPGSPNSYVPQNYDETFRGPISFRSALAMSLNIPAVKALYLAGVQSTMDLVKSMGITTLTRDANHYGLSLVLGG